MAVDDLDVIEEKAAKRSNEFFNVYFRAARKYPHKADEIRTKLVNREISLEQALKELKKLAEA